MRRKYRNNHGFTMAEMLITVAIIVILCGFGFVAVIAHQRNLKRMEMDETAQEIFIAAQNHLTAAEANGQWDSFLKKTKSDAGQAARGTRLGYTPSDYSATGDPNQGSREFYAITTESAQEVQQGAMELILPEGSIDETLRGNHFYVEYDAASGTVYGVFYTDSDHEITADDAQKVSRSDPNARRDYTVDGKRTIIGYYGGALGELKNPKDLYAPAVAVRNAESLVLYVVDKNYNRPVSSETGAGNFQTKLLLTIEGETSGKKVEKEIDPATLGSLTDSFSTAVLADDSKKDFEVEVPSGADSSTTKQVKAKYYAIVLDSIVREDGHFAELFPELIPGEDLKITVTLHSDAGGEDVSETVRVNSLFNSIKTEKKFFGLVEDKTVVTVSNPRHLENLSTEVSGTDFESKQLKKNVTVDSVSIVRDLFWDDDPAAEAEQEENKEKVTPFLTAIDSAKGMDTLFGYYAGGRTAIAKDSVQVYPYAGASAGTGTGAATEGTGTNGSAERISLGACYGITNPAIQKVEGNNHLLAAFRFEGKEESALINEAGEELNIRNLLIMDATSAVTGEKTGTGSSEVVPTAAILIANAKSGSIENIAVRWLEGSGTKKGANQTVKIGGSEPAASDLQGCRVYSAKGIASALIGTVDAVNGTKPEFTIENTTVKTVASSSSAEKDTAHLGVEGETAAVLIGEVKGGTVTLDNSSAKSEEQKSAVTVEGTLALTADRGQENNQIAGGLIGSIVQDENVTIKQLDVTAAAMKVQAAKAGSASAGTQAAGGLVGSVSGGQETRLEEVNLTTKELTVSSEKSAGGLVGETASQNTLTVEKVNLSANTLEVTGKQAAGGAIGNAAGGTVTLKEINVLTAKAAGDDGEVGQTQSGTEKVYGIRVTAVNGKAGGLVGAAENGVKSLAIESSAVSGSGTADQIEAGSSAGGLIGDTKAEATSITGSMASMYVQSEGNGGNASGGTSSTDGAGGLIGSASGNVTISNSYSGGRTKQANNPDWKAGDPVDERARYMGSTTGQGRFNVWLVSGGGAAGGLVGKYTGGNLVLNNTYSTSSVAVSYISNAKAGGLVGEADSLNASSTYCTGRVYFTSGTSNGAMKDEPNDTSNIGTYAGSIGNFSGNGNYYLEGLKGVSKGSIGTLNGSKNPTGIDEKLLTGANYYDNNCPLKSGVSGSQKTYTFDSSLTGQSYPYKTVNTSFAKPLYDPATGEKVENAEKDGNQNESKYAQIGDWEIPEEESTEFGPYALIYYERIWNPDTQSLDPTFYYHGYALPDGAKGTDGNVKYTEISTPQDKLPAGTTWNNHHLITSKDHYVAEDGYLLLISKDVLNETNESEWRIELKASGDLNNNSIASIKNTGWNLDLISLEKYNGNLSSSAEFRGYTAYSLERIGDNDGWSFRPNGQNFGSGLTLWKKSTFNNNDSVPEVGFTYIPFFADAVRGADQGRLQSVSKAWAWDSSTSQYFVDSPASAVIRSARQLRRFAAFDNGQYGYLSKTDKEISIEQRMDITFNNQRVKFYDPEEVPSDSSWYQSPTIDKMSVGGDGGSFSSALREGSKEDSKDYYVLDGLNNKLIGEMHGGRLYNLQITNMRAEVAVEKINFELNSVSAWNISVTNSEFSRGIIGTLDQANVSNFEIKNSTFTNNGFAEKIESQCTIKDCSIQDVTIGKNGFAEKIGQTCNITDCIMQDVKIGKNGIASSIANGSAFTNFSINRAEIKENGFAKEIVYGSPFIDCSVQNVKIGENGIAASIGQNSSFTHCTIQTAEIGKNGFAASIGSSVNLINCSIENASIGENGFADSNSGNIGGEDASKQSCTILNAVIGKNGFVNTNSGSIQNCTVINAIIGGNGFAAQNSGTITKCGIYGDESKYSNKKGERYYSEYYQPNTHTQDTNVEEKNRAYGYNLVTIGITVKGEIAASDIAGFVNQNTGSITRCYVAGKVYGQKNVAGFVTKNSNQKTIENSYANVIIHAGNEAAGFVFTAESQTGIKGCHVLGMIDAAKTAYGMFETAGNQTQITGNYSAIWSVSATSWYPFYKSISTSQGNETQLSQDYYLSDCEIKADDTELVDYGQKVKALSYQQLCKLSIDGLQKGSQEKTVGYYQYMLNDNDHATYPYPMPADQVAYGDWSHQDPGKITLLYYEKKGTNYYFHGYSTTDGENYTEEKTSGSGLENGLLASANATIDEDGYVLILEKNAGWSAFGRADNTGAESSEVNLETSSVFEKVSSDLMNALKDAGFKTNSDRMYSFSLNKYLNYQDTTKQFASWQTLTQESGGVGLTIYTTKGKVPTAKFSFQPFFADTVTVPEVKQENATSSEKTLSFQTTRNGGNDYDYRIRTLRQLKALSDWDGQRFDNNHIADKGTLTQKFDQDDTKRFSYLSTSNEQYENHLTIRQDLDIDVNGTEINFDRLDGNYIGREYGDSSDESVSLKNIAYDFADVVAPSGSIRSLIILNANLNGTATTPAKGNEVAHGGRREFVEYNYGTISDIVVKDSTLGSAGLVYQNGDVPENVLSEDKQQYSNTSKGWIGSIGKNVNDFVYKIEYKPNTDSIHRGTISSCMIENSSVVNGAGMIWNNLGGVAQDSKVTGCTVKSSGFVEKNQAVQVTAPHYKYEHEYWTNRYNWGDQPTELAPDSFVKEQGWPTETTEGTVSVTVDSIIENCQVIDSTVKTNGFVGENSVNTQGSAGSTQGSSGKAQIRNCQVYGTTSYGDLVVGSDSGTAGVADVAGFAGTNGQGAEITNCSVTGTVKGLSNIAGFVRSNAGKISGSYANTLVSCSVDTNTSISGFALTNTGTIEQSHSLGTLTNKRESGDNKKAAGFVIRNADGDNRGITNSYAAVWTIDVKGTGSNYLPFGNNEGTYTNCYAMKLQEYVNYGGSYRATSSSAVQGVICVSGDALKNLCGPDLGPAADGKTVPYLQELKNEEYPFPCGSDIMNYGDWKLTDAAATARTVTLDAGTRAAFSEDVALALSRDTAVMAASDGSTDQTQGAEGESSSTISISDENRQKVQVELGEDEEQLDLSELVPERKGWKLLGWLITAPSELTASAEKTTVSDIVTKITKVSDGSQKTGQADAESTENASEGAGVSEESEETKVTYQLETGTKSYHFAPDAVITVTEDMTLSAVWVPDDDTIAKAKDGTLRMDENGNILDEEDAADSANTAGTTAADSANTAGTTAADAAASKADTDDASTSASGADKGASDAGSGTSDADTSAGKTGTDADSSASSGTAGTDPDGAGSSASDGSTGTSDSDSGRDDGDEANTGSSAEDAATDSGSTSVQTNADPSAAVAESDAVTE